MNDFEMYILENIIKNHDEQKERKVAFTIKKGVCHREIEGCDYIDLTAIIREICDIVKEFHSETFVKLMLANVIKQMNIQEQMLDEIKNDLQVRGEKKWINLILKK